MKVLVVGGGGREHALCWALRRSPDLGQLYCAPGNPGTSAIARNVPVAADEVQRLADLAAELEIDLTVVGPELPLALGIVDEFRERGLRIFGPSQHAAQLESSKVFAKEFMVRHGIPTAPFQVVHNAKEAKRAARSLGLPVVLKADGLAAGKGVLIVRDRRELKRALSVFFEERRFGGAAGRVLVEKCLEGEEVSLIALADGRRLLPLAPAKDYKRVGDGDQGPNTGGMGSHSPSGVLGSEQAAEVLDRVLLPTLEGMAQENQPFEGVLYAGLMLTAEGPQVLEFNVRLGDPEAQSVLLRLEDDLLSVLLAGAERRFDRPRLQFRQEASACLVLASRGYPDKPIDGDPIEGLEEASALPGVEIFHAGTALRDGRVVSAGGRVLNVCALGPDLRGALLTAYEASRLVRWPNKMLRRDIGRRVLERLFGTP
ncbi:MAG: phosphoribosylamine--glycine ligase [Thermoanaerobaculia bacterium]|nr:phosphoribosylamine--glycine ligase [Thermoanaerobaculia bacterium]